MHVVLVPCAPQYRSPTVVEETVKRQPRLIELMDLRRVGMYFAILWAQSIVSLENKSQCRVTSQSTSDFGHATLQAMFCDELLCNSRLQAYYAQRVKKPFFGFLRSFDSFHRRRDIKVIPHAIQPDELQCNTSFLGNVATGSPGMSVCVPLWSKTPG